MLSSRPVNWSMGCRRRKVSASVREARRALHIDLGVYDLGVYGWGGQWVEPGPFVAWA